MIKLDVKKLNKIIDFLKKIPRFLALYAFFVALALIFITAILGVLIFYQYSFLPEKKEPLVPEQSLILDEKIIQRVLEIRQNLKERFEQIQTKKYPNLFKTPSELTK
jgi:hypothetical protein